MGVDVLQDGDDEAFLDFEGWEGEVPILGTY